MNELIKCGHCGAIFNNAEDAQDHAKVCGIGMVDKSLAEKEVSIHKCVKCNAVFANDKAYYEHKRNCVC